MSNEAVSNEAKLNDNEAKAKQVMFFKSNKMTLSVYLFFVNKD